MSTSPQDPTLDRGTPGTEHRTAFARLLDRREVDAVFQPMTDLSTGELVGFEALARGPQDSDLHLPAALFAQAATTGRTVELDWVCRAAAFRGVLDADLPGSLSVFVNAELPSLLERCPQDLLHVVGQAESSLRVFLEIHDGALAADPSGLLETVDRARAMGWGISIDDVGTSLGCLSVLPLVRADVVKIDVRAVNGSTGSEGFPPVVAAVLRHVELTGASLVVKGIESDADVELARGLGARYGQGHHLGSPGPLLGPYRAPRMVVPLVGDRLRVPDAASLRDLVAHLAPERTTRPAMRQVAALFVQEALAAGALPVVLTGTGIRTEQEAATGGDLDGQLAALARRSVLVASFAVGADAERAPGVRGIRLPAGDPLAREPFLVILTDHMAMAMVAEPVPGLPGTFDLVVTQDPGVVTDIAQYLMSRLPTAGAENIARPARSPGLAGPDGGGYDDGDPGTAQVLSGDQGEAVWSRWRRRA